MAMIKPLGKKDGRLFVVSSLAPLLLLLLTLSNFQKVLFFDGASLSISSDILHSRRGKDATKYKECIHHMENQRLPNLIAKISDDPDKNGLKPHNISLGGGTNNATEYMKGLDLDVFRGNRIAMMGDSTLFYPTKWLYPIVHRFDNESSDPKYDTMTLSQASVLVKDRADKFGVQTFGYKEPLPIKLSDGTWIEWMGIAGPSPGELEERLNSMFTKAEEMRPRYIVANMGLHWLHLCGHLMCPSSDENGGTVIQRWANYELDWLERVYNLALEVNSTLLLFKTNNFICDERRTGVWKTSSSLYLSLDNKTLEDCYEENEKFLDSHNVTAPQIRDYCKYGQFTEMGAKHLNDQVADFVRELREQNKQPHSRLAVGIYNDHDVEGCYSTDDSIHHRLNIEVRLRLLSNTITSYSECDGDTGK